LNKLSDIDWNYEAVSFLTGLYAIKKKTDYKDVLCESTNLLKMHSQARIVSFVRIEDNITARIEYSTSKELLNNLLTFLSKRILS
jgi:hypothetical protein